MGCHLPDRLPKGGEVGGPVDLVGRCADSEEDEIRIVDRPGAIRKEPNARCFGRRADQLVEEGFEYR